MNYSPELWGLVVALFVIVAVGVLLFLAVRARVARRKRQLSDEIAGSETRAEERAFNQIKLDEGEMRVLEREGIDVTRARAQLASAQRAYERRDFFSALQEAKACHDGLVAARRQPILPSTDPLAPGPMGPAEANGSEAVGESVVPVPSAAPRNRMESRFQLSLLTDELAAAVKANPGNPTLVGVHQLAAEARADADRGDYTAALGAALKARRLLGGKVESVPPPLARAEAAAVPGSPTAAPTSATCPRCGRAMRASDAFCRGCGAPRAAGACGRCGRPLEPGDQFCAACGAAQASGAGAAPSA